MQTEALKRAHEVMQARREAGEKIVRKTPMEKLAEKPNSLRRAVSAMCWQCQGENADPGVTWRIGNCTITGCALYAVRPHQSQQSRPMPAVLRV
jgi:hypothetical protein